MAGTFTPTGNLNAARITRCGDTQSGTRADCRRIRWFQLSCGSGNLRPSSGTFTSGASLNTPRANATATALNTGQVLISGGSNCAAGCPLTSTELYDPVAETFTNTGSLNVSRFNHTATLLTNGQVLVAGGYSSCATICTSETTAELYDPTAALFIYSGPHTARAGQTATLVPSGDVVIAGGTSAGATLPVLFSTSPSTLTPLA